MTDKYGKIHTDGSRSGGQPLVDSIEKKALALREALERIEVATRNEVRAGDKGYVSRYGINGIALAALEQSK